MIYSYTRNINGFAATLEEEEAANIAGNKQTTQQNHCFQNVMMNNKVPSPNLILKLLFSV